MSQLLSAYKRSAVHNLKIGRVRTADADGGVPEGLVLPAALMSACDLEPWERVIVARIDGDNWKNRQRSFVVPGRPGEHVAEARGSLGQFLAEGDLVCLITETYLDPEQQRDHRENRVPVMDLGFTVEGDFDISQWSLRVEHLTEDHRIEHPREHENARADLPRIMLSSLILGLVVNRTHPSCLHGSAEIPGPVMDAAGLVRHQMVQVHNASTGGATDTYAVPMSDGVVMTTGGMAGFAPVDTTVHVASFALTAEKMSPVVVETDGSHVVQALNPSLPTS